MISPFFNTSILVHRGKIVNKPYVNFSYYYKKYYYIIDKMG